MSRHLLNFAAIQNLTARNMLAILAASRKGGSTRIMDKIYELEQRLKEYKQQSKRAEEAALKQLLTYPERSGTLTADEVLRRELLRHHTRLLLLDEIEEWIDELRGIRLYQLYAQDEQGKQSFRGARQYMTEKEADEVNAAFEANQEHLRWKPIDLFEDTE